MSADEENRAALVPAPSTALTNAGAKSLAARGRADLRVREEAEEWLKKGVESDSQRRYEDAFACFERGIQLSPNHPELLCCLANAYHMGYGVREDESESLALYRRAAELGWVEGQECVGWHYAGGYGVPVDFAEAANWWRTAAGQGATGAQCLLAGLYEEGLGVPQDYVQAATWYRRAAEQGSTTAQMSLGDLYLKGLGVPRDGGQAEYWYRKAAEKGDISARTALATMRCSKSAR